MGSDSRGGLTWSLHPSLICNCWSMSANFGSGCKTSTSLKALKQHSSSRGITKKLQRSMTKCWSLGIAPFFMFHIISVTFTILKTSSWQKLLSLQSSLTLAHPTTLSIWRLVRLPNTVQIDTEQLARPTRLSLLGSAGMNLNLKDLNIYKSSKSVDDARDGCLTKALTLPLLKNTILIFLN